MNRPWLFSDICYNEFAIQVTHAVLGDGLYWNFYSSTPCIPAKPGSRNIHHDARPLFVGETDKPLPPAQPRYQHPLTDFTEANGATEVWLGSHRETRRLEVGGGEYEEMLAEHRKRDLILQATAKKGSLIIRDMRLYHGGHAQPHRELRQMIAMVYNRHFYRVLCWMPFARGTEDFFRHPVLQALCTFSMRKSWPRTASTSGRSRGSPSCRRCRESSAAGPGPERATVRRTSEAIATGFNCVTFISISGYVNGPGTMRSRATSCAPNQDTIR